MTNHLTTPIGEANQGRRGRPFSMRLTEEERAALNAKAAEARQHMPYEYNNGRLHGSVAHFLIWAAMQWKAPKAEAPEREPDDVDDLLADAYGTKRRGTTRRRRPVVTRRRGSTRKPAKRAGRAKAKAKGKRGRK